MTPLPIPPKIPSTLSWHALSEAHNLIGAILLVSLFVSVFRSIAGISGRMKRRMVYSGADHGDSSIDKGKKSVGREIRDPSQGEEEQTIKSKEKHSAFDSQRNSSIEERKDEDARQSLRDQRPNHYLQSLEKEILQSSLLPIYPWTTPPQSLPGPYDAPYYPLPLPTIGVEKADRIESETRPPAIKTESMSDTSPEELETIAYSRRVSTANIPEPASLLEKTLTVSSQGWRRTQWTVTTG